MRWTTSGRRFPWDLNRSSISSYTEKNIRLSLERHRQESGGLVDDYQIVVFEDYVQVARDDRFGPRLRAPGPVDPQANDVTGREAARCFREADLDRVEVDLAPRERRYAARANGAARVRRETCRGATLRRRC